MDAAVVIGAGPGIGRAVAARFAKEGYAVALIARSAATVEPLAADLPGALALTADATDEQALRAALDRAADELGPPAVVVHNTAVIRADAVGELSAAELLDTLAVNVGSVLTAAAHTLPGMAARGRGTFVVTGGMPEPVPAYVSLSLGKAAVRTAVDLLDATYGPAGVHVASVTVGGPVAPGTAYDPDDIAEHYWTLHTQPRAEWAREVRHG
ncbi:SDR family NAD(P)-dependent oxidoreductase [Pseudonocardia sp. CA-107938]|uniref:SDR family NAD(P)-dependent oxidoreductase n=1 Tax=Pseudonocardia sp. CA-107938 TaxID=3240021 RepID=UPI003D922029